MNTRLYVLLSILSIHAVTFSAGEDTKPTENDLEECNKASAWCAQQIQWCDLALARRRADARRLDDARRSQNHRFCIPSTSIETTAITGVAFGLGFVLAKAIMDARREQIEKEFAADREKESSN